MNRRRNARNKGAALAFAIALAAVLVAMIVGLFWISMYFGGEREVKAASDAATLSVGKNAATFSVPLSAGAEMNNFSAGGNDVVNVFDFATSKPISTNSANLMNINQIWAKAMLIAMNAQSMQKEGDLGSGGDDAKAVYMAALDVSQRLSEGLRQPDNLVPYYTNYGSSNPLHMLGLGNTALLPDASKWTQAYMDRGYESNVFLDPGQYPVNFDGSLMETKAIQTKNGSLPGPVPFLLGYHPYQIFGMNFWQVPFRYGEHPHLVSQTLFNENTSTRTFKLEDWIDPLPNAFSTIGKAPGIGSTGLLASGCAQSNLQMTCSALIPMGYFEVLYHRNAINWVVNGVQQSSDTYLWPQGANGQADVKELQPVTIPCGTLSASESVENEYLSKPSSFMEAIWALPPNDTTQSVLYKQLQQRINQIQGTYAKWTPESYLNGDMISLAGPSAIWPDKDALYCSQQKELSPGPPDGTALLLETEPVQVGPNFGTVTLSCAGSPPVTYPTVTIEQGERWWSPGTGFSPSATDFGCLGRIDIYRTTTVYVNGFCPGCTP